MKPTVYVVGGDYSTMAMFHHAGWEATCENVTPLKNANVDLVCFTGGADVSPHLYGEENHGSYCDPIRDQYEQQVYEHAVERGLPMIGICRGGQFLHVCNGGKMIQDIKPRISGFVECVEDGEGAVAWREVHADHHQGIRWTEDVKESCTPIHWLNHDDDIMYTAWYGGTKSLCFQPHPEWGHKETRELFFDLIEEFFDIEKRKAA